MCVCVLFERWFVLTICRQCCDSRAREGRHYVLRRRYVVHLFFRWPYNTWSSSAGFMIDEPLFEPYLGTRVGDADSIIGMPLALTLALLARAGYVA